MEVKILEVTNDNEIIIQNVKDQKKWKKKIHQDEADIYRNELKMNGIIDTVLYEHKEDKLYPFKENKSIKAKKATDP